MNMNMWGGFLRAFAGILVAGIGVKFPQYMSPDMAVLLGTLVSGGMAGWSAQTNYTPPGAPISRPGAQQGPSRQI